MSFSLKSPYQRLSRRMLDISGDRGVLKDVIREGAGELVTPDAAVLGTVCLPAGDAKVPVHKRVLHLTLEGGEGSYVLNKK